MATQFQNKAFYRYTPSLFIIDTPFQLLCAVEAIKEFEIDDYLIIAAFDKSEKRNCQVVKMLEEQRLNYKIEYVEDYWMTIDSFLQNKELNKFDSSNQWMRVFIGNYNALDQWVTASKCAAKHASIIFMDDGSSSIGVLKKGHGVNIEHELSFYKLWSEYTFDVGPYFYTIYSDLRSKKFITYQNKFSHLHSKADASDINNTIYVVGTNPKSYSMAMGISLSEYEGILWRKLSELKRKFSNKEVIYIPHGRDSNFAAKGFCDMLNIKYLPLDCAIEYFFVKNNYKAMAIYGFGSTALLTLKLIMPPATVINWFVDNPDGALYKDYLNIAKYYTRHGVYCEVIPHPHSGFFTKVKRCQFVRTLKKILQ